MDSEPGEVGKRSVRWIKSGRMWLYPREEVRSQELGKIKIPLPG